MQTFVHQRTFANKGSEQVLVYTTQHPEGEPKALTRRLTPNSTRMIMLYLGACFMSDTSPTIVYTQTDEAPRSEERRVGKESKRLRSRHHRTKARRKTR